MHLIRYMILEKTVRVVQSDRSVAYFDALSSDSEAAQQLRMVYKPELKVSSRQGAYAQPIGKNLIRVNNTGGWRDVGRGRSAKFSPSKYKGGHSKHACKHRYIACSINPSKFSAGFSSKRSKLSLSKRLSTSSSARRGHCNGRKYA